MDEEKDLVEYLRENGIRPSIQRLKIYEFLHNNRTHPSAEKIYSSLIGEMPTLSKTTVYNTLKSFTEKNIIAEIKIDEKEAVFDADETLHGHFRCLKCNKIYDFSVDEEKINTPDLDGVTIKNKHVYFKGICKECNENML